MLTIELAPEEVEPYLDRAYRGVVQRANIPGFRKGKAPRRIVEQLYGREYLLNEAMDFMLPEVTGKAVDEAGLDLGGMPSISLEQLDPVTVTATVPLTPAVDLGSYLDVRVPKEQVRITKARVDEELERLRMETAPWVPVELPVELDDLINVTVQGWADDAEIINQEQADFVARREQRVPAPGFSEALVGMKEFDTREFTLDVPEDAEYPEVAGKQCRFVVTLHNVKRRRPARLDDEFAKGVGPGYDSLAELTEKTKEELGQQQEMMATTKHQNDTLQKVLDGTIIDLSPLIVDHETEHVLHDYEEALRTGRMSAEQYRQYLMWAGKSAEEVREESRAEAEVRIKRSLILEKVTDNQGLEMSDEELTAEIEALASGANTDAETVRQQLEKESQLESLRRMLLNRKAIDFLASNASADSKPTRKAPAASRRRSSKTRPAASAAKAGQQSNEEGA